MADTKLSNLTEVTTLSDTDEFYVNNGGTSKRFTKASLEADINPATAAKLATARTIALIGDVTGSTTFDGSANATITTSSGSSGGDAGIVEADATYTIGSGGDYTTISAALVALSKNRPKAPGYTATLNLLAGFILEENVSVSYMDLSWIKIIGADAKTMIDSSVSGAAFHAINATLPRIEQTFEADTAGTPSYGVRLENQSTAYLVGGFRKCESGVYATEMSRCECSSCDFSGSTSTALFASGASTINADGSILDDSATGVYAVGGSTVNIEDASVDSCTSYAVLAYSATVMAKSATIGTTTLDSIIANYGAYVAAAYTNVSSPSTKYSYLVLHGAIIDMSSASGDTDTNVTINTVSSSGLIIG